MSSTRWAVVSDVHSNYRALEAVLRDAEAAGAGGFFCLGDVVGYGPEPNRSVRRLMATIPNGAWVTGNHDDALAILARSAGRAGAEASDALSELIGPRAEPREALLANWDLLQHFPDRVEFLAARRFEAMVGDRYFLVHGGCRNGRPNTTSTENRWEARDEFLTLERRSSVPAPRVILVGHSHLPVYFRETPSDDVGFETVDAVPGQVVSLEDRRWVLNPGSVGQPRDGDPRACFLILDEKRWTVELRRVRYDVAAVQRSMAELGFPRNLIRRLEVGR
ncbi:MAG: metallophosphoesterase family protein [bacterium]|nr:metallophosphoesterase family protein [bacterium]